MSARGHKRKSKSRPALVRFTPASRQSPAQWRRPFGAKTGSHEFVDHLIGAGQNGGWD